jgi:hypothetical protein
MTMMALGSTSAAFCTLVSVQSRTHLAETKVIYDKKTPSSSSNLVLDGKYCVLLIGYADNAGMS